MEREQDLSQFIADPPLKVPTSEPTAPRDIAREFDARDYHTDQERQEAAEFERTLLEELRSTESKCQASANIENQKYDGLYGKITTTDSLWNSIDWRKMVPRALEESSRAEIISLLSNKIVRLDNKEYSTTEFLQMLLDGKGGEEVIETLVSWASQEPQERIKQIDSELAQFLESHEISLSMMALLGRLEPLRGNFVSNELAKKLELTRHPNVEVFKQLRILCRMNRRDANHLTQSVFKFVKNHIFTVQDHIEREIEQSSHPEGYSGLVMEFFEFADYEMPHAQNYLISKDLQEISDMHYPDDSHKEGSLSGVGGGASDEMIYTFKHRLDAYRNRLALGIHSGYPIAEPVLQIAPGYYARYKNGVINRIYDQSQFHPEEVEQIEKKYLAENQIDDDGFYGELNEPLPSRDIHGRNTSHPSNGLMKLHAVWEFKDMVESEGQKYFYDLSRVDHDRIHPMVDAEFLTRNTDYIRKIEGDQDRAKPLPNDQIDRLLFPRSIEKATEYENLIDHETYLHLTELQMRKKLEDDFGVDISKHSFWAQRLFLGYLENQDKNEVLQLQEFTKKFGENGFTAFLSLEKDPEMGKVILGIPEKLDQESSEKIFAKYAEIVKATEHVREYLQANFGNQFGVNPELEEQVIENLLKRGKEILNYADEHGSQIDIQSYLEGAKAEVYLFYHTLKELQQSGEEINLEQFKSIHMEKIVGPQLSDELKQQFMRISEANWSNQGEEGQKVLADFNNLLSDPDRLNKTNFYLVQHGSEVLGFFRLDTLEDNSLYFGSVNARSDLAGAKIGETLLDKIFTSVAQGRLVKADCNPKAPISSKYIGKLGFVATNLTDYAEPGDTFEITRDDRPDNPEKGRIYEFQGKSYKELAALESAYQDHPRARLRHYTFPQEYNIFIGEASNLLHQEPKTIISAYQQERNRREDGSYGVVIGFEQVDLPVAPDQGVSRQEELVSR